MTGGRHSPGFTGSPLDRADPLRHDPAKLAAAIGDWRARLLVLHDFEPVVADDGTLGWTSLVDAPPQAELVLLGLIDDKPHFAAYVDGMRAPAKRTPGISLMLDQLLPGEAATYAAARSVLDWHSRHRFCANCGHVTAMFRAGWGRRCDGCGTEHFPRTDPVVIMIAEHAGRALVGRGPGWPPGRYSALAGFMEPGESIEEAVAREIREEAGLRVRDVRYIASQPWPFPSSLMMACIGVADDDAITLDTNELEEAVWVTRDDVAKALACAPDAPFQCPPPYAIAHTLLTAWLAGG